MGKHNVSGCTNESGACLSFQVLLSPVYLHCVFWFDAAENFFITLTEVIKLVSPHSLHTLNMKNLHFYKLLHLIVNCYISDDTLYSVLL